MAYRINDNTLKVLSEHKAKTALAVRFGIDDIQRIADPKTPKKDGLLRAGVTKSVVGIIGAIRWSRFYAYWQERGYTSGKVIRYTTRGTGAHFAENAAREVEQNPRKYFRTAGV